MFLRVNFQLYTWESADMYINHCGLRWGGEMYSIACHRIFGVSVQWLAGQTPMTGTWSMSYNSSTATHTMWRTVYDIIRYDFLLVTGTKITSIHVNLGVDYRQNKIFHLSPLFTWLLLWSHYKRLKVRVTTLASWDLGTLDFHFVSLTTYKGSTLEKLRI